LASRVIRSYFAWRRAAAVAAVLGDERAAIRVAETTAELDALTDGWFSGQLARTGRAKAEARSGAARAP
ncbi:MAG TPA: hypothetical protein VFT22_27510, partial [Kofleriaceae bacterium]|nr:hypothetical protein [Kofleriaceae bacterium]